VVATRQLSEHLLELLAEGDLDGWEACAGGDFKVFIPDGEDQAMRTYTVRRYDSDTGRLTIDFALHDDGPAVAFARAATAGDEFEISGQSRPGFEPAQGSSWTVLFADQAALPAVCAIAEALPATQQVIAVVEVPSLAEKIGIESDARLEVRWLERGEEPGQRLADEALRLSLPEGPGEVWVGCEASVMRTIRRHLLWDRGLSPEQVHTRAYWKKGVAGHSDHDTGADVEGGRHE